MTTSDSKNPTMSTVQNSLKNSVVKFSSKTKKILISACFW